jgi:hypothetical protein
MVLTLWSSNVVCWNILHSLRAFSQRTKPDDRLYPHGWLLKLIAVSFRFCDPYISLIHIFFYLIFFSMNFLGEYSSDDLFKLFHYQLIYLSFPSTIFLLSQWISFWKSISKTKVDLGPKAGLATSRHLLPVQPGHLTRPSVFFVNLHPKMEGPPKRSWHK